MSTQFYIHNLRLKAGIGRLWTMLNVKNAMECSIYDAKRYVEDVLDAKEIYGDDTTLKELAKFFDYDAQPIEQNGGAVIMNETKYGLLLYSDQLTTATDWYATLSTAEKTNVDFLIQHHQRTIKK